MKLIRTNGRGARKAAGHAARARKTRGRGTRFRAAGRKAHCCRCAPPWRPCPVSLRKAIRWSRQTPELSASRGGNVLGMEINRAQRSRDALATAAGQIRAFARARCPALEQGSPVPGLTTGQLIRPLRSVGCYVPSGRHPLPSTLLMTAIPAQVAGVERIVVVSPKPAPETLAAAHLLGITEFYRVGGAHGIAALAYGTATLARVDKIVGPGNLYVTAAKRLVAFDCAIDMLAGPTEIVVTSEHGNPSCHRRRSGCSGRTRYRSLAIFVTTRADLARRSNC